MEYPFLEVPLLGGGLLIGVIAIVHVFVSHFAVGGGLYLVLTELKGYREKNEAIINYVKKHSIFFILLTLVFGAVTGVGIWFSIGLVHPMGTSALIHAFVWAWAIEWVFFFIEIAAAFIYYYSWDRVNRKTHLAIGWIYFGSAWMSLVIINGILTFMLTPGAWLQTHAFWDGIFNPTFFVSVLIRTAVAVILAGLYGLLTAAWIKGDDDNRALMIRYNSKWLLFGFLFLAIVGPFFVTSIPPLARHISMGGAAAVTLFAAASVAFSALIAIFTYFGPYRQPRQFSVSFALLFMILGLMVTGVTEWTREAVRKPFIIYDYMYSNGLPGEFYPDSEAILAKYQAEGLLPNYKWSTVGEVREDNIMEAGRELFRIQCEQCHTVGGYNGIKPLVFGWSPVRLFREVPDIHNLKPYMPPSYGREEEHRALALWLKSLNEEPEVEVKQ
ncbi:MAG TPA: cytochrome ubiquinol oxidase subunit I [Acidobacteriota bacterium]|nr:cytochrome ubiquinol oxidase subunit I [Acidobacteriota bacterium]